MAAHSEMINERDLENLKQVLVDWSEDRLKQEFSLYFYHPERVQCILKQYFKECDRKPLEPENLVILKELFPKFKISIIEKALRKYGMQGALRKLTSQHLKLSKNSKSHNGLKKGSGFYNDEVVCLSSESEDDSVIFESITRVRDNHTFRTRRNQKRCKILNRNPNNEISGFQSDLVDTIQEFNTRRLSLGLEINDINNQVDLPPVTIPNMDVDVPMQHPTPPIVKDEEGAASIQFSPARITNLGNNDVFIPPVKLNPMLCVPSTSKQTFTTFASDGVHPERRFDLVHELQPSVPTITLQPAPPIVTIKRDPNSVPQCSGIKRPIDTQYREPNRQDSSSDEEDLSKSKRAKESSWFDTSASDMSMTEPGPLLGNINSNTTVIKMDHRYSEVRERELFTEDRATNLFNKLTKLENPTIQEINETILDEEIPGPVYYDRQDIDNLFGPIHTTNMYQNVPKLEVVPDIAIEMPVQACKSNSISTIKEEPPEEINEPPNALCSHLMEIFPDTCPKYLRKLCRNKDKTDNTVNDVLNIVLSDSNHPKRNKEQAEAEAETNPQETIQMLQDIFPDADPNYLQMKAEEYSGNPEELQEFIAFNLERRSYPTKSEALQKQKMCAQIKQYTSEFDPEKFLELIPEPNSYFNKEKTLMNPKNAMEYFYVSTFFRNHFEKLPVHLINQQLRNNNNNIMKTWLYLRKVPDQLRSRRRPISLPSPPENIPLLQELAYISNYTLIQNTIKTRLVKENQEIEHAKTAGLMKTCNCCYDNEVLPRNIFICEKGCEFCKSCVERSVEVAFGEGKLDYPCLADCSAQFSFQTLQAVLKPNLFSKIAQKKQLQEIKAAGVEDLETCPFCDFATIPSPGDKIFRCLNPECMKETCRECKYVSHVPLRCEEVERDEDVKKRTYIEDKMTEALIRKCYKCEMKFIKEDGCNKMTCSCGAMMCYICKKPVDSYKHFNGQGGDQHHLCPLYSDTHKLHEEAILKSAEEAKVAVGAANAKLKIDPTADIKKHYKDIRKNRPVIPNIPGELPLQYNALMQNIQDIQNMIPRLRNEVMERVNQRRQPR